MKSLFIRCSEETYELAHALAKKENRSLNKQIIHMIHNEADDKGVVVEPKKVESVQIKSGLTGLVGTKTQGFVD
jgi:NTP pyrophosphatase (non-canonical NTP hydrolase)|tara:strand:+ start:293 stop:514 length:222 start_codon:yes stop_codon:yes gene_type:complete